MKGLGEKVATASQTGTATATIPMLAPPGRHGLQPALALSYGSTAGQSAFGLGWGLGLPTVARLTSKGLPRYDDRHDTFILASGEELVAVGEDEQTQFAALPWIESGRVTLRFYRPRVEGLFARITHLTGRIRRRDGRELPVDAWRVQNKDGITSHFGPALETLETATGGDVPSVLADPADPRRIALWKITRTEDLFGNHVLYEYARTEGAGWTQSYVTAARYADYGDKARPAHLCSIEWIYEDRPDHHSEFRSGFEIRTTRRCRFVRTWVHPKGGAPLMQREYELVYLDQLPERHAEWPLNGASLLAEFHARGKSSPDAAGESLPPLRLTYTTFDPARRAFVPVTLPEAGAEGALSPRAQFVDLDGNGLPDLIELGEEARYWANLGHGRFAAPRILERAPAGFELGQPGVQLLDGDGDGRLDLLVHRDGVSGVFPAGEVGWDRDRFVPFSVAPGFDLHDPEVKLLDLDGDGVTDAMYNGERFTCFFQRPGAGWTDMRVTARSDVPDISFADPRVQLADMSGDGLQDLVLVTAEGVRYWPNLGFGRFGGAIAVRDSPRLPADFDPRHAVLADLDGDGLADLVYADHRGVQCWINRSGRAFSAPVTIPGTPPVTSTDQLRAMDLLGTGLQGLLWAGAVDGVPDRLRFLDPCGGQKPYLLASLDGQMGARTTLAYRSSTHDRLRDAADPRTRWRTPLPFPVHVVASVTARDEISGSRTTSLFSYHHGYWDGPEREFRGFGRVDAHDTEEFDAFTGDEAMAAEDFMPPLETRTWYHLGPVAHGTDDWAPLDLSAEFWEEPGPGRGGMLGVLRDEVAARLRALDRGRRRSALRALAGQPLRSEVFVLDGGPAQSRPVSVQENASDVQAVVEPALPGETLWLVHGSGARETRWERGDDPATQFRFSGEVDGWGQARLEIAIAVGRGRNPLHALPAGAPAEPYLATVQRHRYVPARAGAVPLPDRVCWQAGYEGLNDGREDVWTLRARLAGPVTAATHRLLAYTRHYYDGDAFQGLPFGQIGATGAVVRSERLAFTDTILSSLAWDGGEDWDDTRLARPFYLKPSGAAASGWNDPTPYPPAFRAMFKDGYSVAGYTVRGLAEEVAGLDAEQREPFELLKGAAWLYYVPSLRSRFDFQDADPDRRRAARGMVTAALDPDTGRTGTIGYDADYGLLPMVIEDTLGSRTIAEYDPRWLQATTLTDPHGHTSHVRLNDLGLVVASWTRSRDGAEGGTADKPLALLEYDLRAFEKDRTPVWVRQRQRVYHALDGDVPAGADPDAELTQVAYSDGLGREIQKRVQAGTVLYGSAAFGDGVLPASPSALDFTPLEGHERATRVIVSGWRRYNNKGAVVQAWEPFFDEGFRYRPPTREQFSQSVRCRIDWTGQAARTLYPDGSELLSLHGVPEALDRPDRLRPTPWEGYSYDPQDNGGRTHPLEHAASRTHWDTPSSVLLDALGRPVRHTVRTRDPLSGAIEAWSTDTVLDVQGRTRYTVDEVGRRATEHELTLRDGRVVSAYDLLGRAWWIRSMDTRHPGAAAQPGTERVVLDAQGRAMETRGPRGSWTLTVVDGWQRPVATWARDDAGATLGVRQLLEYGDAVYGLAGARVRNAINRVVRHYDEAGLDRIDAVDFTGEVLERTRVVLKDDPLLDVFTGGTWDRLRPFRVDWQDETRRAGLLGDAFTTTTAHDALGRPKRVTLPPDAAGTRRVLRPRYNAGGALERLEVHDGATSTVVVERIAHNARGQRALLYGGGVLRRYAYDPLTQRLARVRSERATAVGARIVPKKDDADPLAHVFQDTTYRYDLAGNPLLVVEQSPDCGVPAERHRLERRFTYDPLYRLLTATGRETDYLDGSFAPQDVWDEGAPRSEDVTRARRYEEKYGYDRAGNLRTLRRGSVTRTYEPARANNRLDRFTVADSGGTTPYAQVYDASGNLVRQGMSRHLDWDHANRLVAFRVQATPASEPSVYAQYLYGAGGQRVIKLVRRQGGAWERVISLDGVFEHVKRVRPASTQVATHLHVLDGPRRLMSFRVGDAMDDRTPAVKLTLDDHLGSSVVILDDRARVVNREEYRPYGETCFGSHAFKRFRFTGKERDEESGFQCHGARYYDAAQGRWLSPDPAGSADGTNHYAYARANPVKLVDPSGLQSEGDHPHRDAYEAKRAEMMQQAQTIEKKKGDVSPLQVLRELKDDPRTKQRTHYPQAWEKNMQAWDDLAQKYKNMYAEKLQEDLANGTSRYRTLFKSDEFSDISNEMLGIFRKQGRSPLEKQFVAEFSAGFSRDAKAILRVYTDAMVKEFGEMKMPDPTHVAGTRGPKMAGSAVQDVRDMLAAARRDGFSDKELAFTAARDVHRQGSRYVDYMIQGVIKGDLAGHIRGTINWPGKMKPDDPAQLMHAMGRAIDFDMLVTGGKGQEGGQVQARYDRLLVPGKERALQLYAWLAVNAHTYNFRPISNEPWHWEHVPGSNYDVAAYLARVRLRQELPPEWKYFIKLWINRIFGGLAHGPGF